LVAAVLIPTGCGKKHDDLIDPGPIDPSALPPVPMDLALGVATSRVVLTWSVEDATGVTEFRIYRAEGVEGEFLYRSSTTTTRFVDDQVLNGTTYRYQVSAVKGALEGQRSITVSAVPDVFGLVIEGGAEVTSGNNVALGTRRVAVALVAPPSTVFWSLSEDSTLAGAPLNRFVPSAPVTTYVLSPGDGRKTIYGRYVGDGGSISELVHASIRLDTRALILEVTEDSEGRTLGIGDTLHIALIADTTGGAAFVRIDEDYPSIELFDDGSAGDPTPFDGAYERDFGVTAGLEVMERVLIGSFRDDLGNQASSVFSTTRVTIAVPPGPISFRRSAVQVVGSSVRLRWTENTDSDFAEYRLYRTDPDPAATVSVDDNLVAIITDQVGLEWTDTGLEGGRRYQWGVTAYDVHGFRAPLDTLTVESVGFDPVLTGPGHAPATGDLVTTFQFDCTYSHPANLAPARVELVVDGTFLVPMTQTGPGNDWVGGEEFSVGISLGAGSHVYAFEAIAVDDSRVRLPADPATDFLGPTVTN
jgi:hypothetical protein